MKPYTDLGISFHDNHRRTLCQHRPIFPGRRQPSIVGTVELNCRVRNGNGWTLNVKDTDYIGAPSGIRTRDPLIKSQLLYQLS